MKGSRYIFALEDTTLDQLILTYLDELRSDNRNIQGEAFQHLLKTTDKPVDWAYEVWDEMVATLSHKDNRRRATAAQILCNLAKSDPEKRMLNDVHALVAVTKDERFVTARHCLQALWKVGAAGESQRKLLVEALTKRFHECVAEKNSTLIRYDIVQSLRKLYEVAEDEKVKERALELIETEEDLKYRKKYTTLCKR